MSESRERQEITSADVGKLDVGALGLTSPAAALPDDYAGPRYKCSGPKTQQDEDWLAKRVADSIAKNEKGVYRLTDQQLAQFREMMEENATHQFDLEGIFGRNSEGPYMRSDCGQDVTALILNVPEDGEVHDVACPTCGTVTTVRRTPPAAE